MNQPINFKTFPADQWSDMEGPTVRMIFNPTPAAIEEARIRGAIFEMDNGERIEVAREQENGG